MGLAIALLGAPVVDVDGRPLQVDTRKATALLAYLAVEGRPVRRDTAAALLWPDTAPERSRSALRRTLSTLRGALDGRFLDTGRDAVALGSEGVGVDVRELRSLLAACRAHGHPAGETCEECAGRLRAAAALHRGDFLAGFGLRDSAEFDDWQLRTAAELRRDVAAVLDLLADTLLALRDADGAVGAAERRLALDELHEPAHRRLIQAYAAAGDRAAALEQYRRCVRILNRELGVAPLEATTSLYHAVRDGTTEQPAPAPAGRDAARSAELPLVGREEHLQAAMDAYAAVGPNGVFVAIEGESGSGKTRLAAELATQISANGGVTVAVRCFPDGVAYTLLVDLLRAALREGTEAAVDAHALAEAARLLPELGSPPTPSLDDPAAQARFFDGIATVLVQATAAARPGAVIVDDAQRADAPSLAAIAYLARRLDHRPLLLVATWTTEDTPAAHPLRQLLRDTTGAGSGRHLELGRLTRHDIARLAPAEEAARLYDETHGVPLFVAEYLASARDEAAWPVPAGVRELLAARLEGASDVAAQVVAAVSVLGGTFDVELIRDISGRSDDETVAALEELTGRGIVHAVDDTDAYSFRHEQARALAYERTSPARRRLLHRRAADVLASRARSDADAAAVAHHLHAGGREEQAANWFFRAGVHARLLYANTNALASFREALALGHPEVARIHAEIGDLQTLSGDYAGALGSYETAAAYADAKLRSSVEHRIGLVHLRRGVWERAEAAFEEALAALPLEATGERARILADRSLAAHRLGRDDDAASLAREALVEAERADDPRALAQAHNILGMLGEGAAARAHLETSVSLAEREDDRIARAAALNNLALVLRADGDVERALALTNEARELAEAVGDRHRQAALTNNLADLLHAAGRRDESMARLKEAVALFTEVGGEGAMEPEIWKLREW